MPSDSASLSGGEPSRDDPAHAPGGQWVRVHPGVELWSAARVARDRLTLQEFCARHGVRLTVGV